MRTPCGDTSNRACSPADSCDGQGTCLTNDRNQGFACGDDTRDDCTDPDTCDGAGNCQPNHLEEGRLCGDDTGDDCSAPDTCDAVGVCVDNHETDGTACTDDGIECTIDSCANGQCQHETSGCACQVDIDCDDNDPCTDDICEANVCRAENNTDACDDEDACTENDVCLDGTCSGAEMDCDDDDPCTTDSCVDGTCQNAAETPCCGDGDCDAQAEDVCSCPDDCGSPASNETNMTCNDGQDNDCDGDIDGADSDCIVVDCTDDDECDDGNSCTMDDCEDGECQNMPVECPVGELCIDGSCTVVWEIQVFVSPGTSEARELATRGIHTDGSGVEIPVPDAPVVDGVTYEFVGWEGDVPAGQETADPLILIADSAKTITAVFQEPEATQDVPNTGPAMCGACGNGSGVGMIMAVFGWFGLRLVGPYRRRARAGTVDR